MTKIVLRTLAAIAAGMLAAFVLVVLVELFSSVVHPVPPNFGGTNGRDVRTRGALPAMSAGSRRTGMGRTAFLGTWTAYRIGNRGPAAVVGLVLLAGLVFNLSMLPYPAWFKVANLLVIPIAIVLGGHLLIRRKTPAGEQASTVPSRRRCKPVEHGCLVDRPQMVAYNPDYPLECRSPSRAQVPAPGSYDRVRDAAVPSRWAGCGAFGIPRLGRAPMRPSGFTQESRRWSRRRSSPCCCRWNSLGRCRRRHPTPVSGEWFVVESKEGMFSFVMPARPSVEKGQKQTRSETISFTAYNWQTADVTLTMQYGTLRVDRAQ